MRSAADATRAIMVPALRKAASRRYVSSEYLRVIWSQDISSRAKRSFRSRARKRQRHSFEPRHRRARAIGACSTMHICSCSKRRFDKAAGDRGCAGRRRAEPLPKLFFLAFRFRLSSYEKVVQDSRRLAFGRAHTHISSTLSLFSQFYTLVAQAGVRTLSCESERPVPCPTMGNLSSSPRGNKRTPPLPLSLTDSESSSSQSPSSPLSDTTETVREEQQQAQQAQASTRPQHFPLTEARFAYERAVRRAMRLEQTLYDASELKVCGHCSERTHTHSCARVSRFCTYEYALRLLLADDAGSCVCCHDS